MSDTSSKNPSVLIIDTNPDVAKILVEWIAEKYQTVVCTSTEAGVAKIKSDGESFSVILTNWGKAHSLGTTGERIMLAVKEHCPQIPVIVTTSLPNHYDIRAYGPFEILQKPMKLGTLEEALEHAVAGAAHVCA
ncbi:MAG: response regulator [Candidatus Pacebacteria bacterium]|nr:response regulator [Candidatus Paceibacterota bacterium]